MMETNTFVGKVLMDEEETVVGLIWGQKEQFIDGMEFQIQEFCIQTKDQGKGYGTFLLNTLREELKKEKIINIYLITAKGERTEGFYARKGFQTLDRMVLMNQRQL